MPRILSSIGSSTEFYTWNPWVHIAVVDGRLESEEIARRTLKLVYTDRRKDFDNIEWQLDNRDGKLTRPENLATGLIVRLKLGYINGATPWRAFIINRVQGGVGVWGRENAAVGSNESEVTFYGRNRNAPGGRSARPWRRTAQPPSKKPKKQYPATSDITMHELILDQTDRPRVIKCSSSSDAVYKIAARNGFDAASTVIEDTHDSCEEIVIREGQSDGEWLYERAQFFGFVFKVSHEKLYWHSRNYSGAKMPVVEKLMYGGPDILRLTIDCDFRLPIPNEVKGVHFDYRTRILKAVDFARDKANQQANHIDLYASILDDPSRGQALTRKDTFPVLASSPRMVDDQTISRFVAKHARAFKLVVRTVGNPKLLAGHLVDIGGTGSPFADGRWLIDEARHTLDSSTYETELQLKPPPKDAVGGSNVVIEQIARDAARDKDKQQYTAAGMYRTLGAGEAPSVPGRRR
jgi:phage protein D